MAARVRNEGTVRTRVRRVYSTRGEPAVGTPLQTLLQLVALKAERDEAAVSGRPSDQELREVVSALYQVATGDFDRENILALATRRACSMTGATAGAVALREGEAYLCRSSLGRNAPAVGATFSADSGISGQCVQTAQILSCRDTEHDSRVNAAVCRQLGIRSMVAVPIFTHGSVCGILEVFSDRPLAFHDGHTYILQLIASLLSHSVEEKPLDAAASSDLPSIDASATVHPAMLATSPVADREIVENRLQNERQHRLLTTPFRFAFGFAASAVLFAGAWFAIQRNAPRSTPLRSTPQDWSISNPGTEQSAGPLTTPAQISGIEFKSHGQFTAVRIAIGRPVRHESGRLQSPERVYFDLFDSDLGASFGGKKATTIEVNDSYVARIRALQTSGHGTRIVLDLKCACDYTAVSADKAPYGLSILIQPPHAQKQGDRSSVPASDVPQPALVPAMPGEPFAATSGRITIAIDPGHGGADLGTAAPGGLAEKDLVLDIARRLGTLLTANLGAKVVFTRADDRFIPLDQRDQIASDAHADLLVSIHANSSTDTLTRGVETYYYIAPDRVGTAKGGAQLQPVSLDTRSIQTKRLAGMVQHELYTALSAKDQALRNRGVKRAQFALLMNAGIPAILTEVAFMSSPADERNLSRPETRQRIADGLFQGISKYLNKQSVSAGL